MEHDGGGDEVRGEDAGQGEVEEGREDDGRADVDEDDGRADVDEDEEEGDEGGEGDGVEREARPRFDLC